MGEQGSKPALAQNPVLTTDHGCPTPTNFLWNFALIPASQRPIRARFTASLAGRSLACVILLVLLLSPIFAFCNQAAGIEQAKGNAPEHAGDAACLGCHKQQALPYLHTSHHLTSQLVTRASMRFSLPGGAKTLMIVDPAKTSDEPYLLFQMKASDDRYYQSAVTGWGSRRQTRTEPMDIVIGSGRRGQTFLYWEADRLFELPISYWTEGHEWINSPGYGDGTADFGRPVNPGCLECHATAIRALSGDPFTNSYEKSSLVTGIFCETCHGSGRNHIAKQRSGSSGGTRADDDSILNPNRFSRDRQVDLCALCHSGTQREEAAPAFSFVPGEPLTNYFRPLLSAEVERPDVHGNQVGLLRRSRCFLSSPNLSCSTCHDVHAAERPAAAYSDRCLTCHQWQSCGVAKKIGRRIADNCIDCHMPVQATNVIVSETAGKVTRATMRNHWIKVYPDPASPAK
jgi:Cytochrome c554 and c-prime